MCFDRGAAAVEFALLAPVLLILLFGMTELARALVQANAIEKGLRAGAALASRAALPLSADDEERIRNLVETGTADGSGAPLAEGWLDEDARVTITPLADFHSEGVDVPRVRITATVPFAPLMPGFGAFVFERSHEQAYVGY